MSAGANGSAPCTQCKVGKASPALAAVDVSACVDCAADTYSNSRMTNCLPCLAHSSSAPQSGNNTDCKCNAGYSGPDGVSCTACEAGKFKPANGSAPCTQCKAGKASTALAAVDVSTCSNCSAGTYNTTANERCQACPAYATSHSASDEITDCTCKPGYTGPDGDDCVACEVGKYKPINGTEACRDCPPGYTSPLASTDASSCVQEAPYLKSCGLWCVVELSGEERCYTICGDGMKTEDEECDDGNDSDDDGCSNCTIVVTTEYKKEWACGSSPMNLTAKLEASGKGKQTHIDDEESQTEPPPSPPGQEGNGKWIWTEGRRAASSNSTESDATNSTESDTESNPLPVCNVSAFAESVLTSFRARV